MGLGILSLKPFAYLRRPVWAVLPYSSNIFRSPSLYDMPKTQVTVKSEEIMRSSMVDSRMIPSIFKPSFTYYLKGSSGISRGANLAGVRTIPEFVQYLGGNFLR